MGTGAVKRKYDSPKRRQQAEETRRRLVASARRLFGERGYAPTTIEAIAADADLAVQTFYAVLGSKRAALLAILDELPVTADPAALRASIEAAAGDPLEQLRLEVDYIVRLFSSGIDIVEICEAAVAADPQLEEIVRVGEDRRRQRQRPLVRAWARSGALGVGESEVADVLWAFTGPDVYRLFVSTQRWPLGRYRTWLAEAIGRLLFPPTSPESRADQPVIRAGRPSTSSSASSGTSTRT